MTPATPSARLARALRRCTFALILWMTVTPVAAQAQAPLRFTLEPVASRVWFDGRANLGAVPGEARQVEGWAEAADTVALRDARGAITIQVASIQTGIALRDRHLRAEMAAGSHPVIRFVLDRVEGASAAAGGGARAATLHGTLTIRGVARPVAIPATMIPEREGIRLRGELPLRLSDYAIEPPVRLAGLARMRDELTAHFDVLFLPVRR